MYRRNRSLALLPSDHHDSEANFVSHHAPVSFGGICQRTVKRKINREDRVAAYTAAGKLPQIVEAFEKAKKASSKAEIVALINDCDLPREAIPTPWLNEVEDAAEVLKIAIERKVAFVPGESFHPNGGGKNTMRLNFSYSNPETIRDGITRMGTVLKELVKKPA